MIFQDPKTKGKTIQSVGFQPPYSKISYFTTDAILKFQNHSIEFPTKNPRIRDSAFKTSSNFPIQHNKSEWKSIINSNYSHKHLQKWWLNWRLGRSKLNTLLLIEKTRKIWRKRTMKLCNYHTIFFYIDSIQVHSSIFTTTNIIWKLID